MNLADLTLSDFEPLVGQTFSLQTGENQSGIAFVLSEAAALGSASSAPGSARTPFSLIFVGPLQPVVAQAIYTLEHPTLGRLELFIVPVGQNPQGMQYQAIFT
jgi:hypothetical protein